MYCNRARNTSRLKMVLALLTLALSLTAGERMSTADVVWAGGAADDGSCDGVGAIAASRGDKGDGDDDSDDDDDELKINTAAASSTSRTTAKTCKRRSI